MLRGRRWAVRSTAPKNSGSGKRRTTKHCDPLSGRSGELLGARRSVCKHRIELQRHSLGFRRPHSGWKRKRLSCSPTTSCPPVPNLHGGRGGLIQTLSMVDIVQACRNAWTACGLQPLLGKRVGITPSILGYSLLYPYTDNYLDRADVSAEAKLRFSQRFRDRLRGGTVAAQNDHEAAVWTLVRLIEDQYPRANYPQVFDCLLAIHRAQEESIAQLSGGDRYDDVEVLRMSCAKGGSSVMTDACLARGWMSEQESRFSFEWGVLLQLGDDLQDVRQDIERGSVTLFSRAATQGKPLDSLVMQLLSFSERVGERMDDLPNGTAMLRNLLRMSWRSLIIGAIAESHEFFSPGFIDEAERCSPFRFGFLRARNERLAGRQGLYTTLFDVFLETPDDHKEERPLPEYRKVPCLVAG